ncbi:ABC transporter permease [uncultured Amnibacterium sp.]|uniref:ABC transporter permease n=1 Tax=uncultured Amnibacterium sp. TaxID=1631851 RepID=UPI0035CBE44F
MRTALGRGSAIWPPVVVAILFLAIWQLLVLAFDIKPYLLPSPAAIIAQLLLAPQLVVASATTTGVNALIGFAGGAVIAVVLAALASRIALLDDASAPIVAAVAVLPIVSVAPVLYAMYGADSQGPRQVVAGIAVFAPVFLNTLRGLRQVRPVHRDLMRALDASGWQLTRSVTVPGALPYLFTGLNVASSLAVISALVAEYFGGPQDGLGSAITSAAATSATSTAWAYVTGAIALGLLFFGATLALEWLVARPRL